MPQQAPKLCKRPARKAPPLKGVIKSKQKTNNDKKTKLVIKKLVKPKGSPNKLLAKTSAVKTDKPKTAAKPQMKSAAKQTSKTGGENKSESPPQQKKKIPKSSDKAKSSEKTKPSEKTKSPAKKIVSKSKAVKSATTPKTKKSPSEKSAAIPKKSKPSKEKPADGDSPKAAVKSAQKDSSAKSNVKKVADSAQPVSTVKKEKDRSRSPDKKRLGVTRSSSAPLIPSAANSDVASKENAKSLTTVSRTNKTSLENVSICSQNTTPTKSAVKKSPKAPDVSKDSPLKSKESDSKAVNKNVGDKSPSKVDSVDASKTIKSVPWSEEFKSSELINKTPFLSTPILSPLGKKKAADIVRPIARVKGTIIEKRVDLEKRKSTPSPAKNIEEKIIPEKPLTNAEKLKLELDKKKEICVSTKTSEDTKKVVNEKDSSKILKSPKKTDLGKTVSSETSKNIMVVQPDLTLNASRNPIKCESDVNKLSKVKGKKIVTVKKIVSRPKVLSKNAKTVLKRVRPLGKKIVLVKKISVTKKIIPSSNKEDNKESNVSVINKLSDDSRKVPNIDTDNKVDLKISKVEKCKLNVGKTTPLNRSKSKETIPKKIKTEPKEQEEGEAKKSTKKNESKDDVINEIDPVPKCTSEESKTEANSQPDTKINSAVSSDEKTGKGKGKKTDRSPSPNKNIKDKNPEISQILTDELIKKEKTAVSKSNSGEKGSVSKSNEVKNSSKSANASSRPAKKFISVPSVDNRRRKKLHGFWTGPKRHREASLNALAKVQCLYENESRTHLELGLMKTIDKNLPSKSKDSYKKRLVKIEKIDSTSSESEYETKVKSEVTSSEEDSNPPLPRTLRCQPRGAGKYWEMKISSSEESEVELKRKAFEKRKYIPKPKVVVKTEDSDTPTKVVHVKERRLGLPVKKRRKRAEITMDLKDMVVKKRMASLNASAILAASYEKRSPRSGRDETTSSESTSSEHEEILAKKCKIQKANAEKAEAAAKEFANKNGDVKSSKSKVEVIVNQEADVTITGVYSTHHHEGFCTVSGMQYRISATSHTQTTATTSGDKELPPGSSSAGYTPLGALSSMHPPGGGAPSHLHQGPLIQDPRAPLVGSLGRRAGCSSAFSAPHHHSDSDRSAPPGYFQPAGPLITATPLHGGFKDGGPPPPMSTEQPPQFGRYSYAQPQQVVPYGGGFGTQYGAHAHYGGGEVCYGAGRGPGGALVLPAPSCYRPTAAHCTTAYRHPPTGPGPAPGPPGPHDSQLSPAASDSYAPQYCPPCYQHPHTPPRAPIPCLDTSYQGPCPCPMQSCPKNVHTGPATGNPPAGGGPNTSSPPGGSRAPIPPTINFCIDDKRKSKTSNSKDPPLLNQVLKNECNMKNGPDLRNNMFFSNPRSMLDNSGIMSGRSPKREFFTDPVNSRVRQEANESRGGCCAVAINPSLSLMPPEALGPPSPARGSAGASIPQPPDPPHPCGNNQSTPIPPSNPPQRRARVGKAMVRKSIGADDSGLQTTMLLMCQPRTLPVMNSSSSITSPLQIITEDINKESVNDSVKNEIDSGDEVILLDSPNSKVAPIDLSSSEENNADSKSDKSDCVIIRNDGPDNVIDLSIEHKKEDLSPKIDLLTPSDDDPPKDNVNNKSALSPESLKKCSDNKPKASVKRRLSQPKLEIDLDAQISDSLASNGIGEHVKLQKRQKIQTTANSNYNKKAIISGSYKDLIKKPEKVFKLNNGKRQLNTLKSDKAKQIKTLNLIDSDKNLKTENKKSVQKRKISPSPSRENLNKRKKLANSLLKYTDKKKHKRHYDTLLIENPLESTKSSIAPLMPKTKSATLLQNMVMKNHSIDPVIESTDKNLTEDVILTSPTCVNSKNVSRSKKCGESGTENCTGKNRTVLNINNNVVKKINESECTEVLTVTKSDVKLATEKLAHTKSKSPAALNRKNEKIQIKNICNAKGKCQPSSDVKDLNTKAIKLKTGKTKKCKNRLVPALKTVKKKAKLSESNENEVVESLPVRRLSTPRWSNGWIWEGEAQQGKVYVNNEEIWFMARCYTGMRHERAGDSVRRGDCVLLRAGSRRTEAPFVAKVAQLWENPEDGEMMVSLLWYYRPEHTDCGRQPEDCAEEVFASRHRDANSVACIEDKCYVLTFNEYCRYRKQVKAAEENIICPTSIVPSMPSNEITSAVATNDGKVPLNISPDLVLFCERVYDFRLKKIVRPPY